MIIDKNNGNKEKNLLDCKFQSLKSGQFIHLVLLVWLINNESLLIRVGTIESQEMDLTAALKQLGIRSIFDADKVDFSVSQMFYSVVFTDTF